VRTAELAARAGIAASAVRWYEHAGVIPRAARQANGYRAYDERDLTRLRLVVTLRRLGVDPHEAGRIAELCLAGGAVDQQVRQLLQAHRARIARQRLELDQLDAELIDLDETVAAAGRAARQEGDVTQAPIRVLFVCTGNSARSQIAEALLRRMGGSAFEVASAGTDPKGVNPYTVRALAEYGIDWSMATSKLAGQFVGQPWDYVITVCDRARQSCPVFPGEHNRLHWGLEDPAEAQGTDEEKLAAFRRTAVEVSQRLRPFIEIALRTAGRAARQEAARL